MIRKLEFEGQSLEINSSVGWLYAYRNRFGHDILPDLMPLVESILAAVASILEESKGTVSADTIRDAFNNDSFIDAFIKIAGMEVITVYNILWAMAYNADKSIPGPDEYFNRFEKLPVDVILPDLFYAIVDSSVSSKNAERLLGRLKKAIPSESISSPSQESTEG